MCVCVCADAESTLLDSFVMKGTLLIENTVEDGTVVDVNRFDDSSLALTQMKTMTLENCGIHVVVCEVTGHEPELARPAASTAVQLCLRSNGTSTLLNRF